MFRHDRTYAARERLRCNQHNLEVLLSAGGGALAAPRGLWPPLPFQRRGPALPAPPAWVTFHFKAISPVRSAVSSVHCRHVTSHKRQLTDLLLPSRDRWPLLSVLSHQQTFCRDWSSRNLLIDES